MAYVILNNCRTRVTLQTVIKWLTQTLSPKGFFKVNTLSIFSGVVIKLKNHYNFTMIVTLLCLTEKMTEQFNNVTLVKQSTDCYTKLHTTKAVSK